MSTSSTDQRLDPLIDAYRQASALEAQTDGARPRAALRAAVLAHARVVAQSAASAEPKPGVSETVRAAPAANESKPVWRMVAGVVLGLAGMWLYQLTRPSATDDANVAVMTAPQTAKSTATESSQPSQPRQPSQSSGSTGATVAPVAVGVAAEASSATVASATAGAPAQPETTVAIATLSKSASPAITPWPVTAAREIPPRDRASGANNSAAVSGPRDGIADAARSDMSAALAKVDAPAKRAEQNAAAATGSTSAIPEVATSEPLPETAVASAEMRKAMRPGVAARAPAAPAPAPAAVTATPNAFPATASGAMAVAPPPAAPAMSPPSAAMGASATLRQGVASPPDAALFSAIRTGDINALRAALARGANVNARDETGRSTLQIARDRSDTEMVKALELAGAK